MKTHIWLQNSGTTMRCEQCGKFRFSELRDGTPISHRRAERYSYAETLTSRSIPEPPCDREGFSLIGGDS